MTNFLAWEQTLFKDREIFDFGYIPEEFLYREKQMKSIGFAIAPGIQGEQPQNIVCVGPLGTGKTTSFKKIIEQAEQISPSWPEIFNRYDGIVLSLGISIGRSH